MPSDSQRYFLPLLDRHARLAPGARVLELGYYDPGAALWAAARGAKVVALRPSIDLARELEAAAERSPVEVRLALDVADDERGTFDAAIVFAPFFLGNAPSRAALRSAASALKPEGTLYVQLHKRQGGDTFLRYLETLFRNVELLGMGGGQRRLYAATGPKAEALSHPGDEPAAAPPEELHVRGVTLRLMLGAGVFAARGVDPGSKLLLETVQVAPGATILDLGCGGGVLGLALAAADPTARAVLVDASAAAVALARQNAALNALENVEVRLGDVYDSVRGERFDAVVSNLPAHRGHVQDTSTAERFISGAPDHLSEAGAAWFVANKALPYELAASRAFRQVTVAATDGRYKVLRCTQPHER